MRKTRFWVFAASAVVLLLLGSALFLALEGFGAPVAHAQEEATPTSTGGGGIRTVLTATVEPMATGEAPTEAPAATPSLPTSENTTAVPGTASSPSADHCLPERNAASQWSARGPSISSRTWRIPRSASK